MAEKLKKTKILRSFLLVDARFIASLCCRYIVAAAEAAVAHFIASLPLLLLILLILHCPTTSMLLLGNGTGIDAILNINIQKEKVLYHLRSGTQVLLNNIKLSHVIISFSRILTEKCSFHKDVTNLVWVKQARGVKL